MQDFFNRFKSYAGNNDKGISELDPHFKTTVKPLSEIKQNMLTFLLLC